MYLDRKDISLRKEDEADLLSRRRLSVFRPGNRLYPNYRGYSDGEVVKARIIDVPGSDSLGIPPKFSRTVEMVKIKVIRLIEPDELGQADFKDSLSSIRTESDLKSSFARIYDISKCKPLTKITMEKLDNDKLIDNTDRIRRLFDQGKLRFATLPENNITNLDDLLNGENFSMTFINHDYAGITPKMWNHVSDIYDLQIRSAMVIIDPDDFEEILDILTENNKYIGGGLGVGFKDLGWKILKSKGYGYIDPVADEMQSINFIAHYGNEIHGFNSDASGYVDSLGDRFKQIGKNIGGKRMIVLGAGGTARGIALELVNRGAGKVTIINRTQEKAKYIADRLNRIKDGVASYGSEEHIFDINDESVDAIINLSTKGADGDISSYSGISPAEGGPEKNIDESRRLLMGFRDNNPDVIISDINLTKSKTTPLLDQAKELGLNSLDGKLMVVYQGVQAIWTVFGDKIIRSGGSREQLQEMLLKLIG